MIKNVMTFIFKDRPTDMPVSDIERRLFFQLATILVSVVSIIISIISL